MSNLNDIAGGSNGSEAQIVTKPLKVKESSAQDELVKLQLEAARLDVETKRLAIENSELELKEKTFNIQDLKERLEERELKRESRKQRSLTNGATLRQIDRTELAAQKRCNHRKGGMGAAGVVAGQGDSSNMAVIKHKFANGDTWVRCQRCGKTWKPPVKNAFKTQEEYITAFTEYQAAVNFQTTNTSSSSYLFQFSDGGEYYRQVTESTTLR
jgi:hypothetical protein